MTTENKYHVATIIVTLASLFILYNMLVGIGTLHGIAPDNKPSEPKIGTGISIIFVAQHHTDSTKVIPITIQASEIKLQGN